MSESILIMNCPHCQKNAKYQFPECGDSNLVFECPTCGDEFYHPMRNGGVFLDDEYDKGLDNTFYVIPFPEIADATLPMHLCDFIPEPDGKTFKVIAPCCSTCKRQMTRWRSMTEQNESATAILDKLAIAPDQHYGYCLLDEAITFPSNLDSAYDWCDDHVCMKWEKK